MGPEEEDRDSLFVPILRFTDLNTQTRILHYLSKHRNILYNYVCVYFCVCAHPSRPVREAFHLGEHQVSRFEVVPGFPRHPAASELDHREGIELKTG